MTYTSAVGTKWNEDGSVRPFPGNTVICAVGPDDPIRQSLIRIRDLLKDRLAGIGRYVHLPESSWHMTVFDGVCDQVRRTENWTTLEPLDAPLERVDEVLRARFAALPTPPPFRMSGAGSLVLDDWLAVGLEPVDGPEELRIGGYRDALSAAFGIRHPKHETYRFHITLAYGLVKPGEADRHKIDAAKRDGDALVRGSFGEWPATRPYYSCFPDMASFPERRG